MQIPSVASDGDRERRAPLPRESSTADHGPVRDRAHEVGAVPQRAEAGVTVEKRKAPRRQASLVPSITGIRLSPHGADATLVNISTSGVLVECSSRLQPGTSVTVVFDGTFSASPIEGRVARCSVATIGRKGVLRYHVGIAFKNPITLDAPATANIQPETAPQPPPSARPVRAVLGNRW